MDPVLSSLFPVHQIGSDGFNWWIGQIETNKDDDPKKSGRFRVRIVGQHLKDCEAVPTNELPWANVMMPVTTPFSDGLTTGASIGLEQGNWVIGFYLDNDKQKPIIMGSIGHTKGSTIIKKDDPSPGKTCKSFTTYVSSKANPAKDWPIDNQNGTNEDGANVVSASEPAATYGYIPGQVPPVIAALLEQRSETNPTGAKHSYVIASPKCGTDSNLKSGLTKILGDLLKANQDSGGRLGDYLVSKYTGKLYDYIDIARYHTGRVVTLVNSFIARIKGQIIKLIREGIQKLIDALILFDDPSGKIIGNTGPLADPDKAFKPIREKGNRLKIIKQIFDKIFEQLGCTIADMLDRIAQWIFDVIFGFLTDVFYQATCFIETLIQGILNQILAELENIINLVLGPIQELLSILANPLNIIGKAINYVLSLLGISCSGPKQNCEAIQEVSVTCEETKEDKDWLDKLINDIENGPLDTSGGICDEARNIPSVPNTGVIFIGGVFLNPPTIVPSVPPGTGTTPPSFFQEPPPSDEIISPDPPEDLPPIVSEVPEVPGENDPPSFPDPEGVETPFYDVKSDKNVYQEGEIITYTITTLNIANDTILNYTLSGPNIEETDILEGLTGEFTINSNSAIVQVTIAPDNVVGNVAELLTFSIDGTEAFTTVIIDSNYVSVPGIDDDVTLQPTYSVTSDKIEYVEGEDIIYTITTTNIDDGTVLSYILFGAGINADDIIGGKLNGTFTINNNTAKVVIGIQEDLEIESDETMTFAINGTGSFTDVIIKAEIDTTTGTTTGITPTPPKITPPEARPPITDENGSIITIPIVKPGDPYQKEPKVIITGKGYGATAIALLDDKGYVSEIRVTRTGVNYKKNTSEDAGLTCIIDSYTLITPGVGYTSVPEVYVDGDNTIAEALINDDGYVFGVRVLDRTKTFTKMPKVEIIGGGGAGARVLPSISCLDINDLERRGYTKIGTGKYIDCP